MRILVTDTNKEEWKNRYLAGETARSIAKDFPQFSESTISKHIKKMGISRGRGNLYEYEQLKPIVLQEYQDDKYATCTSLANKYNISDRTISIWLKENNIKIKQTSGFLSHSNQTYFETINTPNKAYLLGFITADGAVTGDKEYPESCAIEVHEKDKAVIDFAKNEINPEATITYCNYNKKHNVRVSFSGVELCKHLEKYGIVKNKSKIIEKVPVELIPQNLLPYYFRGLIDGDGCILETGRLNIYSGSLAFIESVQEVLCGEAKVSKLKIYHGTTYFIGWSSEADRLKLFNYLYKDKLNEAFYYDRKYTRLYNSLFG